MMNAETENDFFIERDKMLEMVPERFKNYFVKNWSKNEKNYASCYRSDLFMYKRTDTNMLIESFHNLLKTVFFYGKRNRRIDRLIFILTNSIQDHYKTIENQNNLGMNGPCHSVLMRQKHTFLAIKKSNDLVEKISDIKYNIKEGPNSKKPFSVDLVESKCSCRIFRSESFVGI